MNFLHQVGCRICFFSELLNFIRRRVTCVILQVTEDPCRGCEGYFLRDRQGRSAACFVLGYGFGEDWQKKFFTIATYTEVFKAGVDVDFDIHVLGTQGVYTV